MKKIQRIAGLISREVLFPIFNITIFIFGQGMAAFIWWTLPIYDDLFRLRDELKYTLWFLWGNFPIWASFLFVLVASFPSLTFFVLCTQRKG